MQFQAPTITLVYPQVLEALLKGKRATPRDMDVRELGSVEIIVSDPTKPYVLQKERKLNYPYCLIEPLLLCSPQTYATVSTCCFYVGKFLRKHVVNQDTGLMDGWYGDRINRLGKNQLLEIYQLLLKDPHTRRAILTIHNSHEELYKDSKDICCTLDIQFLRREGQLDMIVNMRGNDAMLGLPQNMAMWSFFQRMMAKWLGIEVGKYIHRVGSMHLYERDVDKARAIVKNKDKLIKDAYLEKPQEWPIKNPKESLQQAELFCRCEQDYRKYQNIDLIQGKYHDLHPELWVLFSRILVPYINKKQKKLNNDNLIKATNNPYATIDESRTQW